MSPSLAMHYTSHLGFADPKTLCQRLNRKAWLTVEAASLDDISFGQFGLPMARSTGRRPSVLAVTVDGIVHRRTDKEMIRPDATLVVTVVKHTKFCRDSTVMQVPRYSMRSLDPSIHSHMPVSTVMDATRPKPASCRLLDLRPKEVSKWGYRLVVVMESRTTPRAELSMPYAHIGDESSKVDTAFTANCGGGRMMTHRKLTPFGGSPPAVASSTGDICWLLYHAASKWLANSGVRAVSGK